MKDFTITKMSILEGKQSAIYVGYTTTGKLWILKDKEENPIPSENLDEIELGNSVLVYANFFSFTKPSEIKKILRNEDGSLELTTETSVYYIEEVK